MNRDRKKLSKKMQKRRNSKSKQKVKSAVGTKSAKKSSSQSNVTTSAKPIPPPPPLPPASKFRKLVKTHKKKHCPKKFKGVDYEMPTRKPKKKDTLTGDAPDLEDGRWICITYRNRNFDGASQVFYRDEWFWLSEQEQTDLGIKADNDYYKHK